MEQKGSVRTKLIFQVLLFCNFYAASSALEGHCVIFSVQPLSMPFDTGGLMLSQTFTHEAAISESDL